MVSNASDDLPDPENPVSTMSLSRGSSRLMFRRLCSRAPRITRRSDTRAEPTRVRSSGGGTCVRICVVVERGDGPSLGGLRLLADSVETIELADVFRRVAGHERDRSDAEVVQSLRVLG